MCQKSRLIKKCVHSFIVGMVAVIAVACIGVLSERNVPLFFYILTASISGGSWYIYRSEMESDEV